jgi:hypothetical protein
MPAEGTEMSADPDSYADLTAQDIETALAAWRRVAAELIP